MKVKVKVTPSCSTLCDPLDCALSDPSAHGESPDKNAGGLPCPPPGDLSNPRMEPRSPTLQADSLPPSHQGSPWYIHTLKLIELSSQVRTWKKLKCKVKKPHFKRLSSGDSNYITTDPLVT